MSPLDSLCYKCNTDYKEWKIIQIFAEAKTVTPFLFFCVFFSVFVDDFTLIFCFFFLNKNAPNVLERMLIYALFYSSVKDDGRQQPKDLHFHPVQDQFEMTKQQIKTIELLFN